ncbi:hypothetical protein SS50377_20924 [Spironucleus salmonicida]|uniref:EF-hand domain-containing protein n=1 Tax=Spironucleus salmonicida TaxID=348837 RepID=V6LGE4_9EUKA|nr:hypothetical protein SS50377_20924 [Spironucleus salmonicida]|eukprot:EST43597.1 hypothetical protein SS50377_16639 [Spironucleus salmonicida]
MSKKPQTDLQKITEQLGQLTVEERRQKNTDDKLSAAWDYLDQDKLGTINCATLATFLQQAGVVADEEYIYESVCTYRQQKLTKNDFFDKPILQKIAISQSEFKELMAKYGHKKEELDALKKAFAELQRITPKLNYEKGGIITNELFQQMKLWNIMTEEQIDYCRCFFGYNNKQTDILVIEKYFEKLEGDFL